ncbi:MAG: tripartite tricarboxylate transporter substrate binding protein [Alphaproteobacteria bacterium]|nr:tripartite tricarboxylate transporter substrate binding protein [Alphaproteobacteria bacterium]
MIGRRLLLVAAAASLGLAAQAQTQAQAQAWPDKPIKMVVPFPPGGPIDTMARLAGKFITDGVGQQVVIENRPGAGSTIGSKAVASSPPDGYTLLFGSSGSLAVAPSLYLKAGIDPVKMFAPIASFSLLPHVMVVNPQVPAKTLKEFIAHAKANPGKLNYGAGLGTPPYLLSTLFVRKAGLDIAYIPYQGAAPAITDLLAGRTQFTIDGTVALLPHVRAGKLRAIAMARGERWPEIPDVPTLVESGFPDFTLDAWTGLVAPAGTPAPILEKLNAAINAGLKTPEAKTALDRFSSIAKTSTPKEFGAFVVDQAKRWGELVKVTGAKVE